MLKAPKDLKANIRYRMELLKLGNESESARREIMLAASRDPVWFIDSWMYGFNPKDESGTPEHLFVSYPFQERLCKRIISCIGKHDLVIPKSRAVGGTYIILATLFHQWMFRPMQSFLLASAKEDRVDRKGDTSTLFWKLDHFIKCLPGWMRPVGCQTREGRTELRLENLENGSIFNGESTNKDVDRGGRRTCILADEAAVMDRASSIAASIQHVTNSCLWLSTFQGAAGAFYDLYAKYSDENPDWVVKLGWWDHPKYSEGLYYDANGKPRSPWYDIQAARSLGPRWLAQELDMEPAAAGGQFYEEDLIRRLLPLCREPAGVGELRYGDLGDDARFVPGAMGRLSLWCNLHDGRPSVDTYVIGTDIATGQGGDMSSQSVASVYSETTGEKAAEFKHNLISPENLGRYVAALATWFHNAKVVWGRQGPGGLFKKSLVDDCQYGNCWRAKDKKYGFVETPESKLTMHGDYRDALNTGRIVNRSESAVKECRQMIYANGSVEHSRAIQTEQDPANAKKLHGDLVVADAMAAMLLQKHRPARIAGPTIPDDPPMGSPAWKMREYLHKKQATAYY